MRKGFTLIELLAVIVILAIIALIAVPIVIHIINDTKASSEEESLKLYIDSVKKAIARKQLAESSFNPSICTIENSGNLLCGNVEVIVDMKGNKPSKGIIEIKDNKITHKNLLLNDKYYNKITELVLDNNNNKEPNIGDKYTYKVNAIDTFNFYVLSFNNDNTVNLIMDRNICNDGTVNYASTNNFCRYKWYEETDNTYGPVTAMQELYEGTKDWTNVPIIELTYTDEANITTEDKGYISLVINNGVVTILGKTTSNATTIGTSSKPIKARLPKYSEVNESECIGSHGSCPIWLMENIKYYDISNDRYSMNNNSEAYQNIQGYWLMSSYPTLSGYARYISYKGYVNDGYTSNGSGYGVRPVIKVPISYLQ